MNTILVPIRNMHCRSCEIMLEQALGALPNVERVSVSRAKSSAIIEAKGPIDMEQVRHAIEKAGYEVGENERKQWITQDVNEYGTLAIGALIVTALAIIANRTGLLTLSVFSPEGTGLAAAFFIGITAGISTCAALVGGLVLGISARHAEKHPEATEIQKFRPHIFFNIGRLSGFFILGGILGIVGSVVAMSSFALGIITLIVGAVMLILGLQLTGVFPKLNAAHFALPSNVSRALGLHTRHTREYSHFGSFIIGTLTFFLPCGFTQLMQVNAIASGTFVAGGLTMAAFALGTAPALLGIGWLTSVVRGANAKIFFKTAAILIILFAIFNMKNGYALTGWTPFWELQSQTGINGASAPIETGKQTLRMAQSRTGYSPNSFTVKKGIPVHWIITVTDTRSCSSGISVPSLDVRESFRTTGEYTVDFTPTEVGQIRFSCTMGMFPGTITVVE